MRVITVFWLKVFDCFANMLSSGILQQQIGDGPVVVYVIFGIFINWLFLVIHHKEKVRKFPVPSRDVTTKLSLGGNNGVITELILPMGSLVCDIPAGTREPFFTVYVMRFASKSVYLKGAQA